MLSIIIPTYNRNPVFNKTLACTYEAIEGLDAEIIVVNDSKTNVVNISEEYHDKVQLFENPKKGVAAARNYGVTKSKGNLLLLLDDDVNLTKVNLKNATTFFSQKGFTKYCLNLSWEYPPSLTQQAKQQQFGRFLVNFGYTNMKGHSGNPAYWKENSQFEVDLFASYCLFMPKVIFNQIEGYKEEVPFGYEDYDFAHRARQMGIKTFIDTTNIVYHNEFDRIALDNWLNRKEREGYGRIVGPKISGHQQESKVEFSKIKTKLFTMGGYLKPFCFWVLKAIPNLRFFDFFYFSITKFLIGVSFFEGYKKALIEIK